RPPAVRIFGQAGRRLGIYTRGTGAPTDSRDRVVAGWCRAGFPACPRAAGWKTCPTPRQGHNRRTLRRRAARRRSRAPRAATPVEVDPRRSRPRLSVEARRRAALCTKPSLVDPAEPLLHSVV